MPFTLSHPAAAAVLGRWSAADDCRTRRSPSGPWRRTSSSACGCARSRCGATRSSGSVAFCLPVGLLCGRVELVARAAGARPASAPAPSRGRGGPAPREAGGCAPPRRCSWARSRTWRGTASTARRRPGRRARAGAARAGVPGRRARDALANLLQHASTLVGGLAVIGWLVREARHDDALHVVACAPWRWLVLAACGATAAALGLWNGARASPVAGTGPRSSGSAERPWARCSASRSRSSPTASRAGSCAPAPAVSPVPGRRDASARG